MLPAMPAEMTWATAQVVVYLFTAVAVFWNFLLAARA